MFGRPVLIWADGRANAPPSGSITALVRRKASDVEDLPPGLKLTPAEAHGGAWARPMLSLRYNATVDAATNHMAAGQRTHATWMERLSSGMRVNSAKDDAAGLAMAEALEVRTRTEHVLRRNIQNAIDVVNIADGGLQNVSDILIRMRELATQSANGTWSDQDRLNLDVEFQQLLDGLDETAVATKYDGVSLLARSSVDIAFAFDGSGSMWGELAQLKASIGAFKQGLEDDGFDVGFALYNAGTTGDSQDATLRLADILDPDFIAQLNAHVPIWSAQDPYSTFLNASGANDVPGDVEPDTASWRPDSRRHIVLITDTGRETDLVSGPDSQADIAAALAGVGVTIDVITEPADYGTYDQITSLTGGELHDIGDASGSGIPIALDAIQDRLGAGKLADNTKFEIQVGMDGKADDRIDLGLPMDATRAGLGLVQANISTVDTARIALGRIDAALENLGSQRAHVGAVQNRLETAAEINEQALGADSQSESRIRDTDVAEASAAATRAQIRTQGASALLGQAQRLQKEMVLGLLQR